MSDASMDIDTTDVIIRPNSIWISGVDDLSTNDIKSYIKKYCEQEFKIEWVNDSSLNIVFEKDEDATSTLTKLSTEKIEDIKTERLIHPIGEAKMNIFAARISDINDKKVKNAAQYSRYYLFHPKEDRERPPRSRDSNGYRHREAVKRKRRTSEDDIDLFPNKVIDDKKQDDNTVEDVEDTNISSSQSLLERIGTASKLSDRIAAKELEDDDLFKK